MRLVHRCGTTVSDQSKLEIADSLVGTAYSVTFHAATLASAANGTKAANTQ